MWKFCVVRSLMEEDTLQADAGWWHPWHALHEQNQVPREALLVRIPEAPRYFWALQQRDTAAVRPETPTVLLRPVAPYDAYAAEPRRATAAASGSSSRP